MDALEYLAAHPVAFDVVFLDPPFAVAPTMVAECAKRLSRGGWLKREALIYIEAPSTLKDLPLPAGWVLKKSGTAGQVGYYLASAVADEAGG